MTDQRTNRKLAAILAADVVGYSRLMVEFTSVVDAVDCALAIQSAIFAQTPDDGPEIVLRIGINLGDVIADDDDIYGDGVNIAARLEPLADAGGICIAAIVHESVRGRIDAPFADAGEIMVKNIDRPIRVFKWQPDAGGGAPPTAPQNEAPTKPLRKSIAVLPFDNMSHDPEQEYFSDGLAEDLITDLSKIGDLAVIARNSSFAYKGKALDLRAVGRELNAETVLEGSVRRAGDRLRINAQLIDTNTGTHLWAERYDRDISDIFAVQDDVTRRIVQALQVTLTPREMELITEPGTNNVDAHNLFLRVRDLIATPNLSREIFERAIRYGNRALELDPDYAQAHAGLAMAWSLGFHNRWADDADDAARRAAELAERAVALDPNEPMAHFAVAAAASMIGDRETASRALEKSLSLNPNYAPALNTRGAYAVYDGRADEALPDIERAMRLDPSFSQHYLHFMGLAHFMLGNLETAAMMFKERIILASETDASRVMLAAVLGHLGMHDKAREVWAEVARVNPDYDFDKHMARLSFTNQADMDKIIDGLGKSGLPT
ncbi:MAG: adenylate/guanylate cyclase domain-containing protein [Alphaproteobacteria bacterium]